jgi:hypothetical protein
LIGFGLFELALIIERWTWTRLIQSCGFGLDPMRIMTSSSNAAAEQMLAAASAVECFSSNLTHFGLNADRAPQLKASVRRQFYLVDSVSCYKGDASMKVLVFVTLAAMTCIPAFSQTQRRTTINAQAEAELLSLSRKAVLDGVRTAKLVVDDRFTGTTSAVVQPSPGKLLRPKVTIAGGRALVTGLVSFEGEWPKSSASDHSSPVTITFVKRAGQWHLVELCLGTCPN